MSPSRQALITELPFGTDGIRAPVHADVFSPAVLRLIGAAFIKLIGKKRGRNEHSPLTVIIGSDGRFSEDAIHAPLRAGITAAGGLSTLPCHIPTAAIAGAVISGAYTCGIMISASHNDASDNGLKFFGPTGKLSERDERAFNRIYKKLALAEDLSSRGAQHRGDPGRNSKAYYTPNEPIPLTFSYEAFLTAALPPLNLTGVRIALDCAHGALSTWAPRLFAQAGATVVTCGTTPNGHNINQNYGSCHPENLRILVNQMHCDLGFAFDGDGDRIVVATTKGTLLSGEALLALLMRHSRYKDEKRVVTTVMSNSSFLSFCTQEKKRVVVTPVGDRAVSVALKKYRALLGGENSGHIICADYLPCSDGLYAAFLVTEVRALIPEIERIYTPYPSVSLSIKTPIKKSLTDQVPTAIIERHERMLSNGRTLIRYSGTEPVLRVLVEAPTAQEAHAVGTSLCTDLQEYLINNSPADDDSALYRSASLRKNHS